MNTILRGIRAATIGFIIFLALFSSFAVGRAYANGAKAAACSGQYLTEDGTLVYDVPVRQVNGKVDHVTVDVGPDHYLFCNEQQTAPDTILMTCVVEDEDHIATLRTFVHGVGA